MPKGMKFGGRQSGTPNKVTTEIRDTLVDIVEKELLNLPAYLNTLDNRQRIETIIKLLPYVTPKLKETEIIEEDKDRFTINWIETKQYDGDEQSND